MSNVDPLVSIPVGVVVERSKSASPWADFHWRPVRVLTGVPDTPPWTKLAEDGERTSFYVGAAPRRIVPDGNRALSRQFADLKRHCCGSSCGRSNGDPPYELAMVTADPAEGEA